MHDATGATGGVEAAIAATHVWFESNSGWAPPDRDWMADWVADGVCRCPDECIVPFDSWCEHGLASWWLILQAQDADDADAQSQL